MYEEKELYHSGDIVAERFEVIKLLGIGGMGHVYRVHDGLKDSSEIAIKVLWDRHSNDVEFVGRFAQEVEISKKISHPSVVKMYDFLNHGGKHIASMEFANGVSIGRCIAAGWHRTASFETKLEILIHVTNALAHIHDAGVIHRDIKPDNIILKANNQVTLTDLGLARSLEAKGGFTATGNTVGTPAYMAPELIRSSRCTEAADIYSLGIVAFEMITGVKPFEAPRDGKLNTSFARVHFFSALPRIQNYIDEVPSISDVPEWFEQVMIKATGKKPEQRFSSAKELRDILVSGSRGEDVVLERKSEEDEPVSFKKMALGGLALFVVGGVLALVVGLLTSS